ncbi:hypothetical protein [uncultured Helicobacter sp.]|nr:hypothetical protein [uncultured Helicobacter sp.]
MRHNSDMGKHGDTGRSEFDVLDSIKCRDLDAEVLGLALGFVFCVREVI